MSSKFLKRWARKQVGKSSFGKKPILAFYFGRLESSLSLSLARALSLALTLAYTLSLALALALALALSLSQWQQQRRQERQRTPNLDHSNDYGWWGKFLFLVNDNPL